MDSFVQWFHAQGGTLDDSVMGFADLPGQGRGAVALQDIAEGHTLFTIPRELTLSIRTSSLPGRMGETWKKYELDGSWVGLILCMLWEEMEGESSKWSGYLASLPTAFDTPMFWNEQDLQELKGTAVVDKIGKDDAEKAYHERLLPAIQSRPDLFPPESIMRHYTVERYHMMGSRVLSRSFQVEPWQPEADEEYHADEEGGDAPLEDEHNEEQENEDTAMDVDEKSQEVPVADLADAVEDVLEVEGLDDDDDDDEGDPADVAMVPMADMLNAMFESENAKLFYEKHVLTMATTKPIRAGEQIFNTYGDPPNFDLLRRYGCVDLVPLPPPLTGVGNPADIVEIRADFVLSCAGPSAKSKGTQERVDWWLDEAEDDVFTISTDCQLPDEMVSFARLLFLPQVEWEKARKKGKMPKPVTDAQVLSVAVKVLEKRLREYPTTIEDDEALLVPGTVETLSLNKRHAVVVRLGEKRILKGTLEEVKKLQKQTKDAEKSKKRGRGAGGDGHSGNGKKARR